MTEMDGATLTPCPRSAEDRRLRLLTAGISGAPVRLPAVPPPAAGLHVSFTSSESGPFGLRAPRRRSPVHLRPRKLWSCIVTISRRCPARPSALGARAARWPISAARRPGALCRGRATLLIDDPRASPMIRRRGGRARAGVMITVGAGWPHRSGKADRDGRQGVCSREDVVPCATRILALGALLLDARCRPSPCAGRRRGYRPRLIP